MTKQPKTRIDSWKEIAAYLGRDVRTVFRWEKDKKLPVHRVPGGKRPVVFAYQEEIDAWLWGQDPTALEKAANGSAHTSRRVWLLLPVGLALLAGAVILAVQAFYAGPPVEFRTQGRVLSALDGRGRTVWSFKYANPLAEYTPSSEHRWKRRVDVDGNGSEEFLFVAATASPDNPEVPRFSLDCFSASGRRLWSLTPDVALRFGGRRFTPPWFLQGIETSTARGPADLWLSVVHHRWWPAYILKVDAAGSGLPVFVNSGHLYTLSDRAFGSRRFLFAGGVNNEYNAAMLAVLDPQKLPATSPQTPGLEYRCDDCPAGAPDRYFVFPRSELNLAAGAPYNAVWSLMFFEHEMEVSVVEYAPPGTSVNAGIYQARYRFSDSFELLESFRTDAYWDMHRRFERDTRLKHAAENCPERTKPAAVRMWTRERGWQELAAARPAASR
jgi:predicted DNA-binding transcriptional regulator AlpA